MCDYRLLVIHNIQHTKHIVFDVFSTVPQTSLPYICYEIQYRSEQHVNSCFPFEYVMLKIVYNFVKDDNDKTDGTTSK